MEVAIIIGAFSIAAIWYGEHLRKQTKRKNTENAVSQVNLGAVLRDIGIIFLATFVAGLILGLTASPLRTQADLQEFINKVAVVNIIVMTLGFAISGVMVTQKRWQHLLYVAMGTWLFSLINVLLGLADFASWSMGILGVLLAMAIGGVISQIIKSLT